MNAQAPPTFLDTIERYLLRAILLALVVLALLIGFAAWHTHHQAAQHAIASPAPSSAPITLVIDFGDGAQSRVTDIAPKQDMTVLDAMQLAVAHPHPISFAASGSGDTVLLSQIGDVKNEGVGASAGLARNWQYWINAQYGMVSIGVAKVHPGDRITWAFRPYESDPKPPPP